MSKFHENWSSRSGASIAEIHTDTQKAVIVNSKDQSVAPPTAAHLLFVRRCAPQWGVNLPRLNSFLIIGQWCTLSLLPVPKMLLIWIPAKIFENLNSLQNFWNFEFPPKILKIWIPVKNLGNLNSRQNNQLFWRFWKFLEVSGKKENVLEGCPSRAC